MIVVECITFCTHGRKMLKGGTFINPLIQIDIIFYGAVCGCFRLAGKQKKEESKQKKCANCNMQY